MKLIFKNVRTVFFAVTLATSCFGIAPAQKVVKDTKVNSATTESKTNIGYALMSDGEPEKKPQEKPLVDQLNSRMSLVTEEGKFKTEFNSISEALQASNGNSYNQNLKKGNEIIVMNSRCGAGNDLVPVTFSIYHLDGNTRENPKDLSPIIDAYLENIKTNGAEGEKNSQEMVNKVMKILALSRFPQKNACDPVPVILSFNTQSAARLEAADTQNPLIGAKYNNGTLYDALHSNSRLMANPDTNTKAFWDKYGYNNFSNINDAASTAAAIAGTKAIIYNGSTFSIYRLKPQNFPNKSNGDTDFDVLKTTPLPKGWIIAVVVSGSKTIQIYEPKTK